MHAEDRLDLLHNMSSAPRSQVTVQPRPLTPPPTKAKGSKVHHAGAASLSLLGAVRLWKGNPYFSTFQARLKGGEEVLLRGLYELFLANIPTPGAEECADALRQFVQDAVEQTKLVGCILLHPHREEVKSVLLSDAALTFAILSKSSERVFVASKTPNFSSEVLLQSRVTFDPRITQMIHTQNKH